MERQIIVKVVAFLWENRHRLASAHLTLDTGQTYTVKRDRKGKWSGGWSL